MSSFLVKNESIDSIDYKFNLLCSMVFSLFPAQLVALHGFAMFYAQDDSSCVLGPFTKIFQLISFTYISILLFALVDRHLAHPNGLGLWVFYIDHFLLYGHCVIYSAAYILYTFYRKKEISEEEDQEKLIRASSEQAAVKLQLFDEIQKKFNKNN